MAINIDKNENKEVTYKNPPIDRTLFPNLCDCDTIKSEIEKLNQEIENIINSAYITETITDEAVASFTDGADGVPVKSLTVDVTPVQDLHGYDNPWPAGGGVNLINIDTITLSSAGNWASNKELDKPIPAGTYTFAVTTSAESAWTVSFKDENGNNIGQEASATNTPGRQSVTVTLTGTATKIGGYLNAPATMSNFQLESGSTAHDYVPYSNICPISGWTGANVTRTGRNLIDLSAFEFNDSTYIHTVTGSSTDGQALIDFLNSVKGATIISSAKTTGTASGVAIGQIRLYSASALLLTISLNTAVVVPDVNFSETKDIYIYGSTSGASVSELQLESGSTAHDYEAYSGTTYPISFSPVGTVYGGYEKPLTGKLKSSYVKQRLMPDWGWNLDESSGERRFYIHQSVANYVMPIKQNGTYISNALAPLNINQNIHAFGTFYISTFIVVHDKDSHFADLTEFKQWLTDNEIYTVYEVAEPVEYTLDTVTVTTLLGDNNIFADTGNVAELTYRADLKAYIDSVIS